MKRKIRKTGEIIEIVSFGGSTDRNDVLDFVSYIDSNGVEHPKAKLNFYWDLENVEDVETKDTRFNSILRMNTEVERRKIAAMTMASIIEADGKRIWYDGEEYCKRPGMAAYCAVKYADALIAELKKTEQ